jgi:hypothetical protein
MKPRSTAPRWYIWQHRTDSCTVTVKAAFRTACMFMHDGKILELEWIRVHGQEGRIFACRAVDLHSMPLPNTTHAT